ncbi:hypothetical protein T484DRAFT_1816008 [Baffinella frigidus]|nr:hypothetical protein T484DRAFT_1816008 [Cryptophyta sp. CCMP2293]
MCGPSRYSDSQQYPQHNGGLASPRLTPRNPGDRDHHRPALNTGSRAPTTFSSRPPPPPFPPPPPPIPPPPADPTPQILPPAQGFTSQLRLDLTTQPPAQGFTSHLRLDLTVANADAALAGLASPRRGDTSSDPNAAGRVAALYYTTDGSEPGAHNHDGGALYYTTDGSELGADNHDGGGPPPLSITVRRSCLVRAVSVNAHGHTLAHASESYRESSDDHTPASTRSNGLLDSGWGGGGDGGQRSANADAMRLNGKP